MNNVVNKLEEHKAVLVPVSKRHFTLEVDGVPVASIEKPLGDGRWLMKNFSLAPLVTYHNSLDQAWDTYMNTEGWSYIIPK